MEQLKKYALEFGLKLSNEQLALFEKYSNFLIEYNKKVNLTAITNPDEIIIKHFLDSISLLGFFLPEQNSKMIDVGTGAGLPGLPLKILRPDLKTTLLDSRNKKIEFLKQLMEILDVDCQAVHACAQEQNKKPESAGRFDLVVSRAALSVLDYVRFCAGFVRPGGIMVAYKGPAVEDELAQTSSALKKSQLKVLKIFNFALPNQNKRSLLLLKKTKR